MESLPQIRECIFCHEDDWSLQLEGSAIFTHWCVKLDRRIYTDGQVQTDNMYSLMADPRDRGVMTHIDNVLVDPNDPETESRVYDYLVGLDKEE